MDCCARINSSPFVICKGRGLYVCMYVCMYAFSFFFEKALSPSPSLSVKTGMNTVFERE